MMENKVQLWGFPDAPTGVCRVHYEDPFEPGHPLCHAPAKQPDGTSAWDNAYDHKTYAEGKQVDCGNCCRIAEARGLTLT